MYFCKTTTEQSVSIYNSGKTYDGYTLFSPNYGKHVWLIDMKGRIVHHWETDYRSGGDVRLLSNGNLIRLHKTLKEPLGFLGSVASELIELDWAGNIVRKYENPYMHHDFIRLENGNTIINKHVLIPKEIAVKVKGGIPGSGLETGEMWGNAFQEITPAGDVVWEWLSYEHMDIDIDVPCPLCPRAIWAYVNGIDLLLNGDILANFRNLNMIAVIDRQTGEIKWRWGAPYELGHAHNPTVLDNGNFLVFDNGYHRLSNKEIAARDYSRVLEVNPNTNEIDWEYKAEMVDHFYSGVCSSAERLPNGNTLICESIKGRVFEVTHEKEVVWEFISPFFYQWEDMGLTNLIFKAHRYGKDYKGLRERELDPNRFEWVVSEKSRGSTKSIEDKDMENRLSSRLQHLGY